MSTEGAEAGGVDDAGDRPIHEPHEREVGQHEYHVDKELHQEIDHFFKDLQERTEHNIREFRGPPEFEAKALRSKTYLTLSVSFDGGWFFGKYSEKEFGVAVSLDGDGGFFKTETTGFGFGLPVGVAGSLGFTQAASGSDLAGVSANIEAELGKLGVTGSVSPGNAPGSYDYSGGVSAGIGPNIPFSTSETKVETFHELRESLGRTIDQMHDALQRQMDNLSGDRDVPRWLDH